MKKQLVTAAVLAALALPQPAAALPRTEEAFDVQVEICRTGLEMIVGGASDEEELDYFREELERHGWREENDLTDLLLLCVFYKRGYLFGRES